MYIGCGSSPAIAASCFRKLGDALKTPWRVSGEARKGLERPGEAKIGPGGTQETQENSKDEERPRKG